MLGREGADDREGGRRQHREAEHERDALVRLRPSRTHHAQAVADEEEPQHDRPDPRQHERRGADRCRARPRGLRGGGRRSATAADRCARREHERGRGTPPRGRGRRAGACDEHAFPDPPSRNRLVGGASGVSNRGMAHGRRRDPQRVPRPPGRRGHAVIPRASLVPDDDPTTLFTGSGMQPLLPYLLGADHPAGQPPRRQPDLPARPGHRGGRRQPAHDLLRDARQLEPRRLLQGRAAAAVLGLPHREGRAGPRPALRVVLHR